ncbi:uncharacterized protein LOC123298985 [Chrysoperla carnea]|uniref:uncharacterized protein LOC123298985 n=1 Tax=Chrysoperla carnea TaxID=189513 RepID=UPI001D086096|nr:uncharacterized protein LOC123298985 [Chrysoperla carnea]
MTSLFIVVLTIVMANGEYLPFDGSCPDPDSPEGLNLNLDETYYPIAETVKENARSDIADKFEKTPVGFKATEVFRVPNSGDDCLGIELILNELEKGKYVVVHQEEHDDKVGDYSGDFVTFLSEKVVFFCRERDSKFYAQVGVLSTEPKEFDSDERGSVEKLLTSNDLDFLNEYLSPVKHDNPCDLE